MRTSMSHMPENKRLQPGGFLFGWFHRKSVSASHLTPSKSAICLYSNYSIHVVHFIGANGYPLEISWPENHVQALPQTWNQISFTLASSMKLINETELKIFKVTFCMRLNIVCPEQCSNICSQIEVQSCTLQTRVHWPSRRDPKWIRITDSDQIRFSSGRFPAHPVWIIMASFPWRDLFLCLKRLLWSKQYI